VREERRRLSELSLPAILKAIADPTSLSLFRCIASENLESDVLIKRTNLTPKQYYSRISTITSAGLVKRKNRKYCLTSLGKIVYGLQFTTQKAIDNYWKLKAIDSFADIPEKEQLIKRMINDKELVKLLAESTSSSVAIYDSPVETSTSTRHQTKDRNFLNLMLVEDDLDTAQTFEKILVSHGYSVETFTDSFEALKHFIKLNRPYYDLIISDVRMPGINGIQLYQKLKSIHKDVRVMFLTALDAVDELTSVIPEMKKSDIIRKPISTENFISVIEKALNSSGRLSYAHHKPIVP
jgi:CheY-like chemotaxis protein/predicted transcriptional regulator